MNKIIKKIVLVIGLCVVFNVRAQEHWPEITATAKPWIRWWWMGSAVDEKGIDKQLDALNAVGFGGVQVVPIYGAKGYEDKYINYLSPQWMKMLDYTVSISSLYNMGVDISVGTGWPIGGPQVTVNDAATKMVIRKFFIKEGMPLQEKIVLKDEKQTAILSTVTAYSDNGKAEIITDKVLSDGTLQWKPGKGNWELYALFTGKTGQRVKRSASGGEGYTLDHFSSVALENYFEKFDNAFGSSNHGVRSFFNDSYEVYGANWSPDFFIEFENRRGYNLKFYLKYLSSSDQGDITARVKADYRQTMSDLMLENFTTKFTGWANSKKSKNTNQAHGSPANLLDLYAAVDIPESETFGSTPFDIPGLRSTGAEAHEVGPDTSILKFASSAAHVTGKKLVSNETFTWLTEHFKTSWSQCKPEVEQVFLSGINHVFYHGMPYSPADAVFPGWLFYASVNFTPQNSLWPHLKGLNEYVARCQSILQSGSPDNEVLVYWPIFDAWVNPEGLDMPFGIHQIDKWLCPTNFYKDVSVLQSQGFSLDYCSDKMLNGAEVITNKIKITDAGSSYKVLYVPKSKYMPVNVLQSILNLAENGATVVLAQFPEDVPGLANLEENRKKLNGLIASFRLREIENGINEVNVGKGKIIISPAAKGLAYANINREKLTDSGLKFIRRNIAGGKYYYIVNHTENTVNDDIPLNIEAKGILLMDPQTGQTGLADFKAQKNTTSVTLQLASGEAVFIKVCTDDSPSARRWNYIADALQPVMLNNDWKLQFINGDPELPKSRTIKAPQLWTDFTDDVATQYFSGTVAYSTTFKLIDKKADDYILQLADVYESAKVKINGQEAGIIWSVPYKLAIGKYLKKGKNTIEIEINNLMANRIRYMDQNKMEWRKYHEINFVNIKYESFDASGWEVQPSGLGGDVKIVPVVYKKSE